jgi:translation initiation factor 2 alpha subunit (eIF-2alpha)
VNTDDERTLVVCGDKEIESDPAAPTYRVRATSIDKKTGEKTVEIYNLTAEQMAALEADGAVLSSKNAAVVAAHRKKQ